MNKIKNTSLLVSMLNSMVMDARAAKAAAEARYIQEEAVLRPVMPVAVPRTTQQVMLRVKRVIKARPSSSTVALKVETQRLDEKNYLAWVEAGIRKLDKAEQDRADLNLTPGIVYAPITSRKVLAEVRLEANKATKTVVAIEQEIKVESAVDALREVTSAKPGALCINKYSWMEVLGFDYPKAK
jgi:hypothetical protein